MKTSYRSYDYADKIKHGDEVIVQHSICLDEYDISELAMLSVEELKKMEQKSIQVEDAIYASMQSMAKKWEQQAATTGAIRKAMEYLNTATVTHTENKWKIDNDTASTLHEYCSNAVYQMRVSLYERSRFIDGKLVPTLYDVTWAIILNTPLNKYVQIAGQDLKKFKCKDQAIKYISGRKKAYSRLFTEIYPVIPAEYARYFSVSGKLLPGYRVEDGV